ncbi:peptidoglycan-binding protein [Streptomyces sp. URMC 129]|uniref:peptidoglycan-binding domain-containing protein n=1 Tax=Streptomyces sp. URMC 129 TaxID=3423407 RepID=UPI003F1AA6AB
MADQLDCLICGRAARPNGEPDCECLTHSLSRPVGPPQHGPDPADVALFDEPGETLLYGPRRPYASHRKPRQRARIAAAAGGAVAAVVGCTALAASLLGGYGRGGPDDGGPSLALPDGDAVPEPDGVADGGPPETAGPRETGDVTGDPAAPDAHGPEETAGPDGTAGPEPTPSETPGQGTGPTPGAEDPPVLSEGDRGAEVAELQRRLRQLDWAYAGGLHGRYDDETRQAVARFQRANGVTGDPEGVYGPATRETLESMTIEP